MDWMFGYADDQNWSRAGGQAPAQPLHYLDTARALERQQQTIVESVADGLLANPFWHERADQHPREELINALDRNIDALAKAIRYRSPMILDDHMRWLREQMIANRSSTGVLREIYARLWTACAEALPVGAHGLVFRYLQSSIDRLEYTSSAAHELAKQHETLANELYSTLNDPQWQAAYQSAAPERARYEFWLLLDYVIDAVGMETTTALEAHLVWLRASLLQRGLTTLHVQQVLWLLASVCAHQLTPATAAEARRVLEAASNGLHYTEPDVRAVQQAQDALVQQVSHQLASYGDLPHPEVAASIVGWYVAYLVDSIAQDNAAYLAGYLLSLTQSYPVNPALLATLNDSATSALQQHLGGVAAQHATTIVATAQATVQA